MDRYKQEYFDVEGLRKSELYDSFAKHQRQGYVVFNSHVVRSKDEGDLLVVIYELEEWAAAKLMPRE